jgi:hypothetical protein
MAGTFKRAGTHRVECPACPTYGYFTVAMLEDIGLPSCWRPGCGETMHPARLELALTLGDDAAPIVAEYRERTIRKEIGQLPKAKRPCMLTDHLADMGAKAAREICAEQRAEARERRIRAILPTPEPLPF